MVNNSSKHEKAYKYQEMVYTIYLAPAKSSGYEVCPGRTKECTTACLSQSGRNIMDQGREIINGSRIKKTRLFFENRQFLVSWIIDEIKSAKAKAARDGYRFSVRLNNTSDISPEEFYIIQDGTKINLLEYFPDVQFYDYTKVPERVQLLLKYDNYDLTFSYTGRNWDICQQMINQGIRVAAVFNKVPEEYIGLPVIDGDKYDMRYLDPQKCIVGLKYKKVRTKLETNNIFVIQYE
jgi:hypothetical protein